MHARARAEQRGTVVGMAIGVLLVTAVVVTYMARHRTPRPHGWRTAAAVALTLASYWPVTVYSSLVGNWWAGRGYDCGDSIHMYTRGLASKIMGYTFALVIPGVLAGTFSFLLLVAARSQWLAGRSGTMEG